MLETMIFGELHIAADGGDKTEKGRLLSVAIGGHTVESGQIRLSR